VNYQENGYVAVTVKVAGDSDSVYQMTDSNMMTNDAKYHAVQLTRHLNNVTLIVDNFSQTHLAGHTPH